MNFHDLKIIVSQIKKGITCPKCQAKFLDEDIEVIGNLGDEQTFVSAVCNECEAELVIHVNFNPQADLNVLPQFKRLGSAPRMGSVTVNDVLDVRNFLKSFKGNFSELFGENKESNSNS